MSDHDDMIRDIARLAVHQGKFNVGEEFSHGTMQPEHLIPRLMAALERVDPRTADNLRSAYSGHFEMLEPGYPELDADDYECLDTLLYGVIYATLNSDKYVPPYTYVGMHSGDGSLWGCWPDVDSLNDAYDDTGEVFQMDGRDFMLNKFEYVPVQCKYVCVLGKNYKLYDAKTHRLIWEY